MFAVASLVPALRSEWGVLRQTSLGFKMPPIVTEKLPWIASIALVAFLYFAWTVSHYGFNDNAGGADLITRLPLSMLLGAVFVVLFVTTYRRGLRGADDGAQVLLVLLTISAFLLYAAELFRLHDFFGGRHNTVFKFYYEVWIFFAVIGGYGVYYWMRRHPVLGRKGTVRQRGRSIYSGVVDRGIALLSVCCDGHEIGGERYRVHSQRSEIPRKQRNGGPGGDGLDPRERVE